MRGLALKKRLLPLVLGVLLIISMTGCGNVEAGLPYSGNRMIYLQSADNGMKPIRLLMIESFAEQYYDADELYAYALEEVNAFNEEHATLSEDALPIEVVSVFEAELADEPNCIALDFRFANSEVYATYFETECFYGTVAQAQEAGFTLGEVNFVNTKNGKTLPQGNLENYAKNMIYIDKEDVEIRSMDKIVLASDNVTVDMTQREDGYYANSSDDEALKYIILK